MPAAVLARLEGISKAYGERRVLVDLSLEVRGGEVLALLGPNGAGKTTALRILCGLLAPDAGRATIAGHDLCEAPIAARRSLGFVPDGAPLYASLTPREHLNLVGGLHDLPADRILAETERLLAGFDLAERADDPVAAFSRGMRQKTAIACALLPRPPLLVLDEPLSGLDVATSLVIQALIRGWAERGGSVLISSHGLEAVERIADRMAILAEGQLLGCGTLAELRARAGGGSTLEQVFRTLTRSEDPAEAAGRILGD